MSGSSWLQCHPEIHLNPWVDAQIPHFRCSREGLRACWFSCCLLLMLVSQATAHVSSFSCPGRAVPGCRVVLGRVGCFSDGHWFLVCDRPFQKLPAHTHQHHSHRNQTIEAAQRSVSPNSPSRMGGANNGVVIASDEY